MTIELTPVAERALVSAAIVAQETDASGSLAPLLYALTDDADSSAAHNLAASGVSREQIGRVLGLEPNRVSGFDVAASHALDPVAARVVERARALAASFNHHVVGTEHLLLALVEERQDNPTAELDEVIGLTSDPALLRRQLFGA